MDHRLRAYLLGVTWFILSLLSSVANDTISKYLSLHLQSFEVIFSAFYLALLPLYLLCFTMEEKLLKQVKYLFR